MRLNDIAKSFFAATLLSACGSDGSTGQQIAQPPVAPAAAAGASAVQQPAAAGVAASAPVGGQPAPASSAPAATGPAVSNTTTTMVTAPMLSAAAGSGGAAPAQPESSVAPAVSDSSWCGVKQTVDARCTVCHNEQKTAGAPMSLQTYADFTAPAVSDPTRKVYELVKARVHDKMRPMPPQDKLTDAQLAGIDAWVAGGAAASGDLTCGGTAATSTAAAAPVWPPKGCDAMYTVRAAPETAKNKIEAGAETHPQTDLAAPWGNEEVQAIAWKSLNDNIKVLHHWILYGPNGEFLFGWAPGKDYNNPLPDDVGVYLPQGMLHLDMHYNNITGTTEEKDASGVEICVLKKANFRPKTASITMSLSQSSISIAPHAVDQDVTGVCTHTGAPVRLLSASPHAHKNANHMKFVLERAGGGAPIVMHDADFDFNEQTTYPLDPPLEVKEGDKLTTTCTFTNDTDQTITFGENTGNEMCFNFAMYEPMGGLRCSESGGGRSTFPMF